jgi:hypothetical protein
MATRTFGNVLETLVVTPTVIIALVGAWLLVDAHEPAPAEGPIADAEPPSVEGGDTPGREPPHHAPASADPLGPDRLNVGQTAHVSGQLAAEDWLPKPVSEPPPLAGVAQAPARPPEPAPAHPGHPLCIHYDVAPVSYFIDDYYDPVGNHYHGWLPPAGPPFYIQCEWAVAIRLDVSD